MSDDVDKAREYRLQLEADNQRSFEADLSNRRRLFWQRFRERACTVGAGLLVAMMITGWIAMYAHNISDALTFADKSPCPCCPACECKECGQ